MRQLALAVTVVVRVRSSLKYWQKQVPLLSTTSSNRVKVPVDSQLQLTATPVEQAADAETGLLASALAGAPH